MIREFTTSAIALACIVAGLSCLTAPLHAGEGAAEQKTFIKGNFNQPFAPPVFTPPVFTPPVLAPPVFPPSTYCGGDSLSKDWIKSGPNWLDPQIPLPGRFSLSQFSSSTNRISLRNTPLRDALSQISRMTLKKVFVTEEAKDVLAQSEKRIDLNARNANFEKLLHRVLKSTGLTATVKGKRVVVSASSESAENIEPTDVTLLDHFTLESALDRPVNSVFGPMPLTSAISMLSARTGVTIDATEIRGGYSAHSFLPFFRGPGFQGGEKWVRAGRGGRATLRQVLEDIADQVDAELEITGGIVRLKKSTEAN